MNKKITLYELLGLVKDGKAPRKVKGRLGKIYTYHNYCKDYIDDEGKLLFAHLCQLIDKCLDDEVEILDDEDKEKNRIPTEEEMEKFGYNVAKIFKAYEKGVRMALEENNDIEELTYESTFEDNSDMEVQEVLLSKINELVREINKLKKDK